MGDRSQLLDAGLELIAAQGMGGLTHQAVDATAHAPTGTTQEWFPTRQALIEGVTQRCIERETEMATGPGQEIEASPEGIATAWGAFALRALGEDRVVTLARYALQVQAATTPALRAFYAVGADQVDTWAIDIVRRAGASHPERDFGIMANYMTGLVFHELGLPTPEFDPVERLRVLIDTLGWSTA
jgi:DNA-binding transcriptional regulator YbjK